MEKKKTFGVNRLGGMVLTLRVTGAFSSKGVGTVNVTAY